MKTIILLFAFTVISMNIYSQNISTNKILWKVNSLLDSASNESMPFTCEFRTSPGENLIEWSQDNGSNITNFTMLSSSVAWTDLAASGSIEYQVKYNGKNGIFRIERKDNVLSIKLFFIEGAKNLMPFVFYVNNFLTL